MIFYIGEASLPEEAPPADTSSLWLMLCMATKRSLTSEVSGFFGRTLFMCAVVHVFHVCMDAIYLWRTSVRLFRAATGGAGVSYWTVPRTMLVGASACSAWKGECHQLGPISPTICTGDRTGSGCLSRALRTIDTRPPRCACKDVCRRKVHEQNHAISECCEM